LLDRGEKLSARIVALNDNRDARRWEWDWERVRFEVLLEKNRLPSRETYGKRETHAVNFHG